MTLHTLLDTIVLAGFFILLTDKYRRWNPILHRDWVNLTYIGVGIALYLSSALMTAMSILFLLFYLRGQFAFF